MELSPFNIVVENEIGEHLVFNTLRSALVVLDNTAFHDYQEGGSQYREALLRAGLMTESAQADFDLQRTWFEKDSHNKKLLALCLAPSYACNLSCPYCYEKNQQIPGIMSEEVIDRIAWFVGEIFRRDRFEYLHIQWYGGEPVLCVDLIESLSQRFIDFCDNHSIAFGAELISNTTLIDESIAARLSASRVTTTMATLAGCKELHNCRRPQRTGDSSFENAVQGILNLRDAGVDVGVTVNMDKKTLGDYRSLRAWAIDEKVTLIPTMLRDYLGILKENDPTYDLYSLEEFSHLIYELSREAGYNAQSLRDTLSPIRNFCRGQLENYFVIDALGDVYKCDGRMGYPEYALFNICDDINVETLSAIAYNPYNDPLCTSCALLPLCKGQCAWDRALLENACHPLLYTISEYIKDYRNCFGAAEEPVTILAEPRDLYEFYEKPFGGDGLTFAKYSRTE